MELNSKFKEGDRVTRPVDIWGKIPGIKHGIIFRRYDCHSKKFGYYPELYEVIWDSKAIGEPRRYEAGFLPHGLDRETLNGAD